LTRRSSSRAGRSTAILGLILAAAVLLGRVVSERPLSQNGQPAAYSGSGHCTWEVHFSPNGGATEAIVRELDQAKKTILVQAYSFTSAPIAEALLDARKRGVDVRGILDESQVTAKYSSADFFSHTGINLRIDAAHAIAHNKVIVIDGKTVITGSFNFTRAAEQKNAENLLILHDKSLAQRYTKNWKLHEEHSETYESE
jgi:phosphatidylserine/phosphatidylglycerophosphate/cardiolipin synthase-like enzyme